MRRTVGVLLLFFGLFPAFEARAGVVGFQWHLQRALAGEGSTAVDCQRAIARFLHHAVHLPEGITVTGRAVTVEEAGPVPEELDPHVYDARLLRIRAAGPEPVVIQVRPAEPGGTVSVYRRVSAGLYVRIPPADTASPGNAAYEAGYPGEYVIAREQEPHASKGLPELFDFLPVSSAPEAKENWELYPVAPDTISGPVPLLLVHGLGTNRWADFEHWAEHSDEAALLREHFQVWNFNHPISGVTAPIGFCSTYPSFSESIVAYLARFIDQAEEVGVEVDGKRYYFPGGPYAFLSHSQGCLKVRAFLVNYPEHAERVLAAVSLSGTHMGTPLATPTWLRHTLSRIGLTRNSFTGQLLRGTFAELLLNGFLSIDRQSDLDTGWANFDAAGGFGIPIRTYRQWHRSQGFVEFTLSPRDANVTGAREIPGIDDDTFVPPELLDTYCGGLDLITPTERGGMHLDKFFVYAGYIDVRDAFTRASDGEIRDEFAYWDRWVMNGSLRAGQRLMGVVDSAGSNHPIGTYRVNDGLVPLQSQLLLDGRESTVLYKTQVIAGWKFPVYPTLLRHDLIRSHTLVRPERIRILEGWSHLDTVTGRYHHKTGRSELFRRVLDDLLSALQEPVG